MDMGQQETGGKRWRRSWLIGLAGFLVLAGFFSVLLAPKPSAPSGEPAGEPPTSYEAPTGGPLSVPPRVAKSAPAQATPATAPPVAVPAPEISDTPPEPSPPPAATDGAPKVAILMTDMGTSPAIARAAIASLPPPVSFGFSPYGSELAALTGAARAKGHEIWVGVPMQPKRYPAIDPGKNTLLATAAADENIRRLDWALAQVPGPRNGLYNHMGSAFTASSAALTPVLQAARDRGLLFVDARSGLDTVGPKVAAALKLRAGLSRGFLDDDPAALPARLADLVAAAKKDGSAIGLVEAKPQNIEALKSWTAALDGQGVTLVTAGQLAR